MVARFVSGLVAGLIVASFSVSAFAEMPDDADPRIGEEVDQICFRSTINSWRTVGDLDDVVLLQRGVNDWYYVELIGGCSNRILRTALAIGIGGRPSGACVSSGDIIIVRDNPAASRRCAVQRIYRWDDDAVVADDAPSVNQ